MNLDILRTFAKVAETGSLTKASQVLDKPQPGISRKIAMLERTCGGHLFVRTGRGVVLTALGERVFARAQALLREADSILAEATSGGGGLRGEVAVGVIPSLAGSLMSEVFFRLRQRHQGIMLRILEAFSGELDDALARGELDMAVLLRGGVTLQGAEESFGTWQTHLIGLAGDPVTSAGSIPFSKLQGLPLILSTAPSGARLQIDEIARAKGIKLNIVAEANSGGATLALIRAGAGYSVSPATAPLTFMSAQVAGGRLQAALVVDPVIQRTVVLRHTPARPRSAVAIEVANAIGQVLADLRGSPPGDDAALDAIATGQV